VSLTVHEKHFSLNFCQNKATTSFRVRIKNRENDRSRKRKELDSRRENTRRR
jgi:hypothetical protein